MNLGLEFEVRFDFEVDVKNSQHGAPGSHLSYESGSWV
jgi:hypothetical protein